MWRGRCQCIYPVQLMYSSLLINQPVLILCDYFNLCVSHGIMHYFREREVVTRGNRDGCAYSFVWSLSWIYLVYQLSELDFYLCKYKTVSISILFEHSILFHYIRQHCVITHSSPLPVSLLQPVTQEFLGKLVLTLWLGYLSDVYSMTNSPQALISTGYVE